VNAINGPDKPVVSGAASGDLEAFTGLVREHQAGLRAFVRALGVEADWVDDVAQEGTQLKPGDILGTASNGTAEIVFLRERTRLVIERNTQLALEPWEHGKRFKLTTGKIEVSAARQRPFRPMFLLTPHAEARVVGTKFNLAVGSTATRLEVTEGTVRFTPLAKAANTLVRGGQYAVASANYDLQAQPLTGSILREYWTNVPGELWIDILLSSPDYPNHPSGREYLTKFEAPRNWGKDYGARICGFVHPPVTGDYTFWLSGSTGTGLFLSPDDDPDRAIQVATGRNDKPYSWTDEPFQQSQTIHLVAGRKYFIEALQKHGRGADHLEVAWQGPGRECEVIPGEFLSPLVAEQNIKTP
jgi:hypothetical protein